MRNPQKLGSTLYVDGVFRTLSIDVIIEMRWHPCIKASDSRAQLIERENLGRAYRMILGGPSEVAGGMDGGRQGGQGQRGHLKAGGVDPSLRGLNFVISNGALRPDGSMATLETPRR